MQEIIQRGCTSLIDDGPGMLALLVVLYGFYRLLLHLGSQVGLRIIGSLEKPAEALTRQAESMDRLTSSIQDYVNRDADEHKEIIMLQKVIRQEIMGIRSQFEELNHGRREDRKTS